MTRDVLIWTFWKRDIRFASMLKTLAPCRRSAPLNITRLLRKKLRLKKSRSHHQRSDILTEGRHDVTLRR